MIKPNAFLGLPLNFKDICKIYPPTVNDVIQNHFDQYFSILTISQDILDEQFVPIVNENPELIIPTSFEYIYASCAQSDEFYDTVKQAFKFFIKEDVTFLWDAASILIGDLEKEIQSVNVLEELRLINADNFLEFQDVIRESCGKEKYEPLEDLSQLHPKVREMKLKARERDKVKAKQNAKNAPSLETCLASICCMGIGLTPLNIGEISYASIYKLINTNQLREKYDMDCRSLMMGADPKKIKMEYWIRDTEKEK